MAMVMVMIVPIATVKMFVSDFYCLFLGHRGCSARWLPPFKINTDRHTDLHTN